MEEKQLLHVICYISWFHKIFFASCRERSKICMKYMILKCLCFPNVGHFKHPLYYP